MVKLESHRTGQTGCAGGMQLMGGMGYTAEGGMEEQVRATLPGTIAGGTSQVQRDIIARSFGL